MAKIFLDSNVIIDIIANRDYPASKEIFELSIEDDRIQLFFAECGIANLVYIAGIEIKSAGKGIEQLKAFLNSYLFLSAPASIYIQALESEFSDKEDALHYFIALHHGCDYFVTRNEKHFKKHQSTALPVMNPVDFIQHISH